MTTFGATDRQVLWGVRIPLAMPSIILAINQMVMMVLAMAIIAGMVGGGGGLGYRSIEALTGPNKGLGAEVGIAIVIMATILDRLTQATAKRLQQFRSDYLVGNVPSIFAADNVFSNKQPMVIGPVPPGIGVIAPATACTESKSTSPTIFASSRDTPTSITVAPGLT